jgi:hypothetical protein
MNEGPAGGRSVRTLLKRRKKALDEIQTTRCDLRVNRPFSIIGFSLDITLFTRFCRIPTEL